MEKKDSVVDTLDTVLNDESYLLNILDNSHHFNDNHLYEVLAITLDYYLTTRDKRTTQKPQEIKTAFDEINHRTLTHKQIENVIDNGFLTHSFNGIEREYIARYGFDYWGKISDEERKKLLHVREGLKKLESEVGKNYFQIFREEENDIEIVEKEVFLTVPGTKTIHYCNNAPERFYLGPVGFDSFEYFPMIAGESKKDYLMRILKYRIENMTYKADQEELMEIAESVISYYTKQNPCISFIPIQDLINKPVYATYYGQGDGENLKKYCERISSGKFFPIHAFTTRSRDIYENPDDMGNLVTLSTDISKDTIEFARFPDMYDLKQSYIKEKGIKKGDPVMYHSCKPIDSVYEIDSHIKTYYKGI